MKIKEEPEDAKDRAAIFAFLAGVLFIAAGLEAEIQRGEHRYVFWAAMLLLAVSVGMFLKAIISQYR